MKIRNEQMDALLQTQMLQKSHGTTAAAKTQSQSFDKLLAEQLGVNTEQATKAAPLDPLKILGQVPTDTDNPDLLEGALAQTAGLLDNWEGYAKSLTENATPKQMWNMLGGMEQQISSLRTHMKQLGPQGEGLTGIVNELEVLASVEKAKLNRGDYS